MGDPDRGLADRSRWNAGRRVEVGHRVTVRRHLAPGETSHLYTDVIGHVVALDPQLVVRRADGEELTIPDADVAVLKVLPPRPVRARDVRDLEYAGALAWPGTEFELVDGWFCRAGEDWSYRGDSAVPVLPWASVEDLDGVRDWYAARGLPLRLVDVDRLVDSGRMRLDGQPVDPDRVRAGRDLLLCTVDCRELLEGMDSGAVGTPSASRSEVELARSPADDWVALYHTTADLDPARVRPAMLAVAALDDGEPVSIGGPAPRDGAEPPRDQTVPPRDLTEPPRDESGTGDRVVFARYTDPDTGRLAAIARGAVTTGPGGTPRVAVSCVETADGYRRRGLAEVVTAALVEWGQDLGARQCHLHVFADNAAGRGLWAKLGLEPHHTLRHLVVVD